MYKAHLLINDLNEDQIQPLNFYSFAESCSIFRSVQSKDYEI